MGQEWDVLLVTSLSGQNGVLPNPQQTDDALREMVQIVRQGQMDRLLAFDRSGDLLRHHA